MFWCWLWIYWMTAKLTLLLLCAGGGGVVIGFFVGLKWAALMEEMDKRQLPPVMPNAFKPKPRLKLVRKERIDDRVV